MSIQTGRYVTTAMKRKMNDMEIAFISKTTSSKNRKHLTKNPYATGNTRVRGRSFIV